MSESSSTAVHQLRTLGEDLARRHPWPDYLALGLGEAHVPELIRMVADAPELWAESEGPEGWAPIHAWRTLGQLRDERAIEPLLELLPELVDTDWGMNELPTVFSMLGPASIPGLARVLMDSSHGLWTRTTAAESLKEIASSRPEARPEAIAALIGQMEKWYRTDEELNAFLIADFMDLQAQAREAAPVIEQAFAADRVDESICGDWEDVQVALGLLPERQTPRPRYSLFPTVSESEDPPEAAGRPQRKGDTKKKKSKRKAARESRKKNRRRK